MLMRNRLRYSGRPDRDIFSPEEDFPVGSGLKIYSDQKVGDKVQTRMVWGSYGEAGPVRL